MTPPSRILFQEVFDNKTEVEIASMIRLVATNFRPSFLLKESFASYGIDGRVSFTVGRQHGIIDLTAHEQGLKLREIRSTEWQKKTHLPEHMEMKPKYLSLMTARALFPGANLSAKTKTGKPSKKIHTGIVDALLIAYCGTLLLLEETAGRSKD